MAFVRLDFEYTPEVTVINEEQFDVHMKLYDNYINQMNRIDAMLYPNVYEQNNLMDSSNLSEFEFRGLKREETYALDGVILHEMYFENIGSINSMPNRQLMQIFEREYEGYEQWKDNFSKTARISRGWTVFCYDPRSDRFRNCSYDSHDLGDISKSIPLLVLDVYEHAYFLQYQNRKDEYINKFMKNIDWNIVSDRMESI